MQHFWFLPLLVPVALTGVILANKDMDASEKAGFLIFLWLVFAFGFLAGIWYG